MTIVKYFIHIIVFFSLAYYFHKKNKHTDFNFYYWPSLSFKIVCGILYGLMYVYIYDTGDIFYFKTTSDELSHLFFSNPYEYFDIVFGGKSTRYIHETIFNSSDYRYFYFVRLISPLYIFCGMDYWICGAYLSFFSFAACWRLAISIYKTYHTNIYATIFSFLLLPGFVFWSSGFAKETITIATLFFFSSEFLNIFFLKSRKYFLFILSLVCIIVIAPLKYYYVAVLIPVLASYAMLTFFKNRPLKMTLPFYLVILIFGMYLLSFIHPVLAPERFIKFLYRNYTVNLEFSQSGDAYVYSLFTPDIVGVLKSIPEAMLNGLFGPLPWHASNILSILCSIENSMYFVLTFLAVYYMYKSKLIISREQWVVLFISGIYILTLAIFMALSAPNWGTLVRYKVAYLPFFILIITSQNKLFITICEKSFSILKRCLLQN